MAATHHPDFSKLTQHNGNL